MSTFDRLRREARAYGASFGWWKRFYKRKRARAERRLSKIIARAL